MISPVLVKLLTRWLRSLPPSELAALADQQASIVDYLRRRYGSLALAWARGYLTASERVDIAQLTDADFDALLEQALAAACPEQAAVLLAHRSWYRSQLQAIQGVLAGRAVPDGGSRSPLAASR